MKTIIAGTRTIANPALVAQAIRASSWAAQITEVVSGKAPGVDTLGEQWAHARGLPVVEFPADWDRHGKAAGPIRNEAMACYADALILVWDGVSPGSANMLKIARQRGLRVYVYTVRDYVRYQRAMAWYPAKFGINNPAYEVTP